MTQIPTGSEPSDPLSAVLEVIRLRRSECARVVLGEPWAVAVPPVRRTQLHFLVDGSVWFQGCTGGRHELRAGAAWLVPTGSGYSLGAGLGAEPRPLSTMMRGGRPGYTRRAGGPGQTATLVCVECDLGPRVVDPLAGAGPSCIIAREAGPLLSSLVGLLDQAMAAGGPATRVLSLRLAELSFLEFMRCWLLGHGTNAAAGWLAALRDPGLSRALGAMMDAPASPHDLESLARASGMSRSAFAERFRSDVGVTPIAWLRGWRLKLAAQELLDGRTVEEAASLAGFASTSAFSRAFARDLGDRPGVWRARQMSAQEHETTPGGVPEPPEEN